MSSEDTDSASRFLYNSLNELADVCIGFFRRSLREENPEVSQRRRQLAKYVRTFHEECRTLTPCVSEALRDLEESSCLLLMTAHQPNLFAYSGVLRKATLNHVLAEKLADRLKVPVVSFFGLADQDFTDDRWVRSALLPDVQRRDGYLDLRFDMPKKLILNSIAKPSRRILDAWRDEIENWIESKLSSIASDFRSFGLQFSDQGKNLTENFEGFWSLVENAYERAEKYADFNAFVMSWIVNNVWGYGTLFSRFSECQQVFEPEFCFLLSRFDDYSRYVKEAMVSGVNSEAGVYAQEFETAPFWYHCNCGSKARLNVARAEGRLLGQGRCVRCDQEYELSFGSEREPRISEIVKRISARSISMPLVFFHGLKVGCYVGGVGGTVYLRQAQHVAERLNTFFSPVAVWRPKDSYLGVGQLEALMVLRKISGAFDVSGVPNLIDGLKEKIASVQSKIDKLEAEKIRVCAASGGRDEGHVQTLKGFSAKQAEIRREADFPMLVRNVGLLENVGVAMDLHPSIVDYAVNVGLKETSEQWIAFLKENGCLSLGISLKTAFDGTTAFD